MSSLITASIVNSLVLAPRNLIPPRARSLGPTRRLDRPEIRKSFNGAVARGVCGFSGAETRTAAAAADGGGGGWMAAWMREKGRGRREEASRVAC